MKRAIGLVLALSMVLILCACSGGGADTDWTYIEKKGELIIGITYFEPMNYLDDQGNLRGFET